MTRAPKKISMPKSLKMSGASKPSKATASDTTATTTCRSEAFRLWREKVPMAQIAKRLDVTEPDARALVNAAYMLKRGR